jgi:hypothetical protein
MESTKNVIILTSGISGSSVLTGLISRAGYWTGEVTHKKEYDTYENQELIDLNIQLFKQAGYTGNYALEFSSDGIRAVTALSQTVDSHPFREFMEKCNEHQPWIWKDPRLWMTIRFWDKAVDLDQCKFILMTRSFRSAWVSSILRRHIRSYRSLQRYEQFIKDSLTDFLRGTNRSFLHVTYENLIVHPERVIGELNTHLGTHLSVDDLRAIYHLPLYRIPRNSPIDFLKAVLIYLKNYSERLDIAEAARR